MNLTSTADIMIEAPATEVWDALVNPEKIKQYMFGTTVQSSWAKGDPITWTGEWKGKTYEDKGKILTVEPNYTLSYTHYSPLSGQEDRPENYHTVVIQLREDENKSIVSLTQDGNTSEKERQKSSENWDAMLGALKKLVEAQKN